MNIFAWLLVGLVAGVLAKPLIPGRGPSGIIATTLLGIGGAIGGGFIAVGLGHSDGVSNFDAGMIFAAVAGAMLPLLGLVSCFGGSVVYERPLPEHS